MGDSVNIDWGQMRPAPDFSGGMAQSFEAGRQMGLQRQSDNALARARANPDDPQAMTDLALYNPQAANAFMAVKANQRAIQARSAASDVFKSYGNITAPPPVASPPVGMPQATTAPNVPDMLGTLPGPNGQPGQPMPQGASAPSPIGPQSLPNGDMQPGTVSPTAMLQPDHPITQAIGGAVATGQLSLPDAIAKFAQFADPQETAQMIQSLGQMDKLRRDRLGESADALAGEAVALKNVPQAQRLQVAMSALPQLAAHGITPEMLQKADLSDAGLNGIIGQSIGAKALIDEADKQTELGYEGQRIGIAKDQSQLGRDQLAETTRRDTMEFNKPVGVPFGQSLVNPQTGNVVYDGFGGGSSGGGDPYNVVVGNGQYGKPAQPLTSMTLGQVYDFGRSTLIPNSKAAGVGKDSRGTLGSSASGAYQITGETLAKIAPQVLGANWRNQAFTPEVQDKLGAAIYADAQAKGTPLNKVWASLSANEAQALKGQPWEAVRGKIIAGESGGSGGQSGGMNMLQATAEKIANYDMPPPSGRAAMTPQAMMTMQIVKTMNPTYDATQFPMRQAAVKAFGTGKQGDAVRSFNVAVDHLDKLQGAAKALGNGNIQLFNSISNAFRTAGGSPIPTNFEAIKNFVMDETTKAIVGTSGGVADRDKAAAIINAAQSPEQLAGAIYQVKSLMVGQLRGLQQQYETSTGRSDFPSKLSFETRYLSRIGRAPDEAVSMLKQNPSMASAFDQKYGHGASKWYLRN